MIIRSGEFGNGSDEDVMKIGLEVGLKFLRATKPPPLPLKEREERALEFTDSILTLTSAVISVPSGTASLTDCGIIPALVSTIALEGRMSRRSLSAQAEVLRGNSKMGQSCLHRCHTRLLPLLVILLLLPPSLTRSPTPTRMMNHTRIVC